MWFTEPSHPILGISHPILESTRAWITMCKDMFVDCESSWVQAAVQHIYKRTIILGTEEHG